MSKIDFSHFKKTAQDKNCATLMHPDGHEIKISISGLSPAMRKSLMALPLHQAEGSKEEVAVPEAATDEDLPNPTDFAPALEQPAPVSEQPAAQTPAGQVATPEPSQEAAPQAAQPSQAAPGATAEPLVTDPARVAQTPMQADETPEQHYAKEIAFQQDLANRHIEPKTYSSLFAEKGTLGKIGTIFGLMLAGAGSGLTGGPNALLEMMNKEIDRDLEAQKQSKANANTFLNTQYNHDMQEAQALHMTNQNALTQQQIAESKAKMTGEAQKNAAINKQIVQRAGGTWDDSLEKQNAQIGVDLRAKNKMLSTVAQHLDDITPNNPAAKQALNTVVKPAIDAEIKQNIVKAQAKKQAASALKATQAANAPISSDAIDMDKYHKMLDRGIFNAKNGIPINSKTDITPEDDKSIQEGITKKTVAMNNYKDVMDAFQVLSEMPNSGETPISHLASSVKRIPWIGDSLYAAAELGQGKIQKPRDQLLDALSQRLSAKGASSETMAMIKNALSPSMFDTKETLKKGAELVHQHFNHLEEAHPGVFKKYNLDKDIPKVNFDADQAWKKREALDKATKFVSPLAPPPPPTQVAPEADVNPFSPPLPPGQ